jgi:Abortive infection C-terminus
VQTLRELIERHSDANSEFRYYLPIIDKAERNEALHPDITIECCTSLFQGVSKTIVHQLEPASKGTSFDDDKLHNQVRRAFQCLKVRDDVLEDTLPTRALSMVQVLAELRNARGDISHGRAVPKELQSDRSLSRLVLHLTEPVLRYMLASFFAIQPERTIAPPYEDNETFNASLDEDMPMPDKLSYSRALYEQYPEDYVIKLKEYNDEQAELSAELDAIFAAQGDAGDGAD